ncbi:hypothetical protein FM106_11485 [Brachybacterium faecium]|nr:hypothetical protein FM106_11485 [Brachybacterium faecium]
MHCFLQILYLSIIIYCGVNFLMGKKLSQLNFKIIFLLILIGLAITSFRS